MSRWGSALALCVLLIVSLGRPDPLRAQSETDPLAAALSSYRNLDYDQAAGRLRAALARTGGTRLSDTDRARALMYVGATEVFRGQRATAEEAFRNLLIADARYRPDQLIFPPEVVALFEQSRIGVRAVSVMIASSSDITVPPDRLPIRLFASTLHNIRVRVTTSLGAPERVLYEGVIGDSLVVAWDGREAGGRAGAPGRYLLRITSSGPEGNSEREVQVPLEVEHLRADTLPWPAALAANTLRPESEVRANGMQQFLTGLVGAAVVVTLPSIVGASDASTARYGVAGAIGVAGIIGLTTAARPRPLPANIAWNNERRAEWDREVARVRAENEIRNSTVRLRVRAERAVTVEIR